ncbi:uncharacterized protein PSANT_00390 [Moesziomyces antarcticus]|uniref:Transmembrane protein n=2 Tax=Pseudozyma antarctica TaxID=84753 RepID=A0A5C3FG72_PSEA2|nr:uncharacterized protein PSANT_00390 [Moesziomyces antarcticus]
MIVIKTALVVLVVLVGWVVALSSDPGVYPGGDQNPLHGWRTLPTIPGASIDNTTLAVGNATLVHYIDAAYDARRVKRAVIQIHGENRDAWNQWLYADLAAQRAAEGGDLERDEVVVMAPMFFNTRDRGAYPYDEALDPVATTTTQDTSLPTNTAVRRGMEGRVLERRGKFPIPLGKVSTTRAMIWKSVEWGEGANAYEPVGAPGSFEALDAAVDFFLDRTRFPHLRKVVVAGFSLGAQLTNRYATFRTDTTNDDRVAFWISSPNSFVYLTPTRPLRIGAACASTYADYKYGLNGTLPSYISSTSFSASELIQRYLARTVYYLVGMQDDSAGLDSCAPNSQGRGHLDKMWYWTQQTLPYLPGSTGNEGELPPNSEVRFVAKTGHQDWKMITSDPGVETLLLKGWYANGTDARAPKSNGVTAANTPSLHQVTNAASTSHRGHVVAVTVAVSLPLLVALTL